MALFATVLNASDWPKYIPKIEALCGSRFSSDYDLESLKKHNIEIARGQTDGGNECNEPLRYVWYACQSEKGRQTIRSKGIRGFRCSGTGSGTGNLELKSGILSASRAAEESRAYERSRKQFESLTGLKLTLGSDDPYSDQAWGDLRSAPNPVGDTDTYCTVDGKKVEFDSSLESSYLHRGLSAKIDCQFEGKPWSRLVIVKGKATGFTTSKRDSYVRVENFVDGIADGKETVTEDGKIKTVVIRSKGLEVSSEQFHPNGKRASYSKVVPQGRAQIGWNKDGEISELECSAKLGDDPHLAGPCGFRGASKISLRDSDGNTTSTVQYLNGVIQNQQAGDSRYAPRSTVSYSQGKKDGLETIVDKKGRKVATIHWSRGRKHGEQVTYFENSDTVERREKWEEDELVEKTTYYMNSKVKIIEGYEGKDRKTTQLFMDTGEKFRIERAVRCRNYYGWCLDGEQERFHRNGQRASLELFQKDAFKSVKVWDENGVLVSDRDLMPDGSVKEERVK